LGSNKFSSPPRFFTSTKANTYINAWKAQDKFAKREGVFGRALDIAKY
jgi:hypothetical protein